MSPESVRVVHVKRIEQARKAGKASQASGRGHRWTVKEARAAIQKRWDRQRG